MKAKIGKPEMTPELKAYFRAIGSAGGKKASAAMTPEERSKRARKAARAREAKRKATK